MPNELFVLPRRLLQAARGVTLTIIHPYLSRQDTKTVYLWALNYDESFERSLVASLRGMTSEVEILQA